ncbi:DNA repair protein XRCC4 [Chanos chanos]|uniref:DNA repair protein XRCC4 n=1 Tax=Chanos chanos TaxID=29144 RepID=A0A6J2V177_CHACN|nr:DNA repair protein XRCC4 [Chanos chanos]
MVTDERLDKMRVSVRQISVASAPEGQFFLRVERSRDLGQGFVLQLCDGVSAWSGEVSEEDVTREAQEMEMQREVYVGEIQQALTGPGLDYSFHLDPQPAQGRGLQLCYEKVQRDVSFRLGVVELQPVPEPTEVIREIMTFGLEQSAGLLDQNKALKEENQRLRNEHHRIRAEMERYVEGKENLEQELYSRFVLVLNEKKAKIRSLQDTVRQLQDSIEEERNRRKEQTERTESRGGGAPDRESDYGGTTDEEQEDDTPAAASRPPTQERADISPVEDSLSDLTDVAPCRKRRHRHLQKLETEAKRASLEQRHKSRQEPTEARGKARGPVAQRSTPELTASADPDDLFDDI